VQRYISILNELPNRPHKLSQTVANN